MANITLDYTGTDIVLFLGGLVLIPPVAPEVKTSYVVEETYGDSILATLDTHLTGALAESIA